MPRFGDCREDKLQLLNRQALLAFRDCGAGDVDRAHVPDSDRLSGRVRFGQRRGGVMAASRQDLEQLNYYISSLHDTGFKAEGILGFKHRAKEIVRIAREQNADMLVLGAHGHTGLKDFIYGQTVNSVRHELKIPVLVVNL